MRVRSSDYNRTLSSAESFLMGFYPLGTGPHYQRQFALPHGYQPIPIHTMPRDQDDLLTPMDSKPHVFMTLLKPIEKETAWHKKQIKLQTKFKKWSTLSGMPINNFGDLSSLGDNLAIRKQYNIALPNGFTQADADEIISLSDWAFLTLFNHSNIASFNAKKLLIQVDNDLNQAIKKTRALKYTLYSAHDFNLLVIINALKIPIKEPPPYASSFSILLFKDNLDAYYIQLKYNQKLVTLPNCKARCLFDQFHSIVRKIE